MQTNTPKISAEDDNGFRLSRIRAEGWKAAQTCLASGNPGGEKKIAALNPYDTEVERKQWYSGFNSALERL